MNHSDANDFTSLYRAAFAERDPEKKLVLLGQVQQAIEKWQRTDEPIVQKKPAQPVLPSRPAISA